MRRWGLVPRAVLAVACQPTGRLERTASPVKWEVARGTSGSAVTDGGHRFRFSGGC